jgi:hypothetical protein
LIHQTRGATDNGSASSIGSGYQKLAILNVFSRLDDLLEGTIGCFAGCAVEHVFAVFANRFGDRKTGDLLCCCIEILDPSVFVRGEKAVSKIV